MRQEQRWVLTDHDGTVTNSEEEFAEYGQIVLDFNAKTLGIPQEQMFDLLDAAGNKILEDPEQYGWVRDGLIVAAATSDHYIFHGVATRLMLEEEMQSSQAVAHRVAELGGLEGYRDLLFHQCAPKLGIYYRDEAAEFLHGLQDLRPTGGWAVVTNSDAEAVTRKLQALKLGFEPHVVGGAKKYDVSRDWTGLVPAGPYTGFPWFPERGVELQRRTFYETLLRVTDGQIHDIVFVEDVGEFVVWLDYLIEQDVSWGDARTALVLTSMTPRWERERYTDGAEQRFGSESLVEILDWIRSTE